MKNFINLQLQRLKKLQVLDFLPLLAIRIYLIPVFYTGARSKILHFDATATWMGDPVSLGGLGMPFPTLMAVLAAATETAAVVFLGLGFTTRLLAAQLIFFLTVAGLSVHLAHGWYVVADKTDESMLRLNDLMQWLAANFPGRYNYVTELADPVMLNNGIEFTTTYMIMLLVLLFFGAGRYVSCDYWISRYWRK
jgi:putative oxidoreductase